MNANQLIAALENRKSGTIAWIAYEGAPSGLKASAKREGRITKQSFIPLQLAAYENRKAVSAAVTAGDREAPEMPAWLEYVSPVNGGSYIARHRENGTLYFRAPAMNIATRPARYFLDGAEVEFSAIADQFTASALAPKPSKADLNDKGQDLFRGVKLENIAGVS